MEPRFLSSRPSHRHSGSQADPAFPPPQISDSLKHFGLSPSTTSLLLVHLAPSADEGGPEADEILPRMEALVEGGIQSLDLLGALPGGATNYKALRKVSCTLLELSAVLHDCADIDVLVFLCSCTS